MRTSLAIGLLLSVSFPSLLVGAGCAGTVVSGSDQGTDSAGLEDVDPARGTGGGGRAPTPEGGTRPTPPPSEACWLGEMGDGFTCHDTAALRDHAQARCARMGAELASFVSDTLNPSCAEHESSQVFFECCGAEPPPPPPPGACWKGELGDGSSCIDLRAIRERANAMCVSTNAVLTRLDYREDPGRCGGSAATMAVFECCASEPLPPPPNRCWGREIGDGRSCIDLSALKERAHAICSAESGVLTRLDYRQDPGRCGDGAATMAVFECCGVVPPPPPPPPPDTCWGGEIGDGRSCIDLSALKERAYAICSAENAVLTRLDYRQDPGRCGDGAAAMAVFECCASAPPPPPPPPPDRCWGSEIGDGRSCIDLSALKERAHAICSAESGVLTRLDYRQDPRRCGDGAATMAVFECCASAPPPPPPPPDTCWGGEIGDGRSCIDLSALKERAHAMCARDGSVLAAFDYVNHGRCADHEANQAKFACCTSTTPPPR